MKQEFQQNGGPAHAKKQSKGQLVGKIIATIAIVAVVGVALLFAYKALQPTQPYGNTSTSLDGGGSVQQKENSNSNSNVGVAESTAFNDKAVSSSAFAGAASNSVFVDNGLDETAVLDGFPIPVIAEYDGVFIHSPIHVGQLEGILFHQASFETAFPLETKLASANPETMLENPDYEISSVQPTGNEYMNALALHLWREDTPTEMDTSIDVGAEAGTQVYAPVTGMVVLVATYDLYETCEDYEIHIQPEGRPDLDVVEIHISDVMVKAGDTVEGGVTPIAKVRDLAAEDITDIQIGFYTKEGHGNHTHVQVNNADYPEYRETRLKDAYKVE